MHFSKTFSYFTSLTVLLICVGGCDSPLNHSKDESLIPLSGEMPLPTSDSFYNSQENNKSEPGASNIPSQHRNLPVIDAKKIEPLLTRAHRQTGQRYVAVYSVHDSDRKEYHYVTATLGFSPEAIKTANGHTQPFYFQTAPQGKPETPIQVLAATIPDSKQADDEMRHWIRSKLYKETIDGDSKKGFAKMDIPKDLLKGSEGGDDTCYDITVLEWFHPHHFEIIISKCTLVTGGGGDNDDDDNNGGGSGSPGEGGDVPCKIQLIPTDDCPGGPSCPPPKVCGPGGGGGGGPGGGNSEKDCAGVEGGSAYIDDCGVCVGGSTGKVACEPCTITTAELGEVFPNASLDTRNKLLEMIGKYGEKFGLDSKEKITALLGQVGGETGGLQTLNVTEGLYYKTPSLLVNNYPSKFSQTDSNKQDPDNYLKNSKKLANYVYCCKYHNGPVSSGDGWRYRGRGILQLTWKANYQAFTSFYNSNFANEKDFEANPGLLKNDSKFAILSGMWYFKKHVIDTDISIDGSDESLKDITKAVRNTTDGWKKRKQYYNDAKSNINCDNQ